MLRLANPVSTFRWVLPEDKTRPVTPGVVYPTSLGVTIQSSASPAVASGTQADLAELYGIALRFGQDAY